MGKPQGLYFHFDLILHRHRAHTRTHNMKRNNFLLGAVGGPGPSSSDVANFCMVAGSVQKHTSFHNSTVGSTLFTKGACSFGHAVFNCPHILGCSGIVWLMWSPTAAYLKALQHHSAALRLAMSKSGLPNASFGIPKLIEHDGCSKDGL